MPREQIEDEKTYQKIRDRGESKGKAARIAYASAGQGKKSGKSQLVDALRTH